MKQSEKGFTTVAISTRCAHGAPRSHTHTKSIGCAELYKNATASRIFVLCVLMTASLLLASCGSGGGLSGFSAAPLLPEFNSAGQYSPYYATGEMNEPRYLHEVVTLDDGLILVTGGSDESGFSSLDSAELFDQGTILADESPPDSEAGTFINTDFEGNPIAMETGRIFHRLTKLPDSRILISGGAPTLGASFPLSQSEIYDPLTRTFETIESGMVTPRLRHQVFLPPSGQIIMVGGQVQSSFTEQESAEVGGGGFGGGAIVVAQQVDTFPSTRANEIFDLAEDEFLDFTLRDSSIDVELTTRRGRSNHTMVKVAGPDNRLNTGDDLFFVVGGYQTLSGDNAPTTRFPGETGAGSQNAVRELEFFDPVQGLFSRVPGYSLSGPRINFPLAFNLGEFNNLTLDGVEGMGNVILIMNGDDDHNTCFQTTLEDEVAIATFSGFGPAQGLQLFRQTSSQGGHFQGIEAETNLGGISEAGGRVGRSRTHAVSFPRVIESGFTETSVYTAGGVLHFQGLIGCFSYVDGTIGSGVIFDPFFSLEALLDFESSPRDPTPGRLDPRNPFGVIGTWLALDGVIPGATGAGFGDVGFGSFARINSGERHWGKIAMVAGPDGVLNSQDDRPILIGGGNDFAVPPGGDVVSPSAELLILPGRGSETLGN